MPTEDPKELFVNYLESEGLNVTKARKRIAEEVFQVEEHFDVTDLWAKLHEETSISMSTIYRTLDLMLDAGFVREVDLGESHTYYESVFGQKEHGHMVCLDCGKVIEFSSDRLQDLIQEIIDERGFEKEYYRLQIFGHCNNCED